MVALYKSELTTLWFGFAAGLVLAVGRPDLLGWHVLILATLGLVTYYIRERLNLESLYARLLLVSGGVLVFNIYSVATIGSDQFLYLLWSTALTGTIYTAAIAWLFFLVKEGRITIEKIKALF